MSKVIRVGFGVGNGNGHGRPQDTRFRRSKLGPKGWGTPFCQEIKVKVKKHTVDSTRALCRFSLLASARCVIFLISIFCSFFFVSFLLLFICPPLGTCIRLGIERLVDSTRSKGRP